MGGDEYTLLLPQIRHEDYIAGIATKIISTFAEPWIIYGHEFYIHSSIGISIYPEDGEDPETLIRNADLAMYHAKEQGRNNYQFYNPAMNTKAFERMVLENSLHHALERSEFVIHYQPQVDLRTGKISGLEALVRWSHPELGLIYPAHFIPLAEETGLIIEIGEWVLRAACAQGKQWEKTGYRPVRIAVNLSARQIRHSNLIDTIERTLKATDFDPTRLELEITENIAMHNVDITVLKLRKLSGLGIQLSIDDFGSGYSSLSYLKRLPIQTIKIDRSFMNDLTSNPDDAAIVSAVIAMSRSLNIRVVAEGVETEEQLAFLRSRECNEIQGFLFGAPQPAEKIETILKKDLSFY
jgi:EAL domain-containing protein (putative c-di-GMP-specific phosphodiesterase class I)